MKEKVIDKKIDIKINRFLAINFMKVVFMLNPAKKGMAVPTVKAISGCYIVS